MRTIGLIGHAAAAPARDLWARFRLRLQADAPVRLPMPRLGWVDVAALGMVVATLVLVPDAVRLLTAGGLL